MFATAFLILPSLVGSMWADWTELLILIPVVILATEKVNLGSAK
jgi:hypothetical protein